MNGRPVDMSLPVDGREDVRLVAWHQGGVRTLRTGKRHLVRTADLEDGGVLMTLCGRRWRRSREVTPNDYWTDDDCRRCTAKLERDDAIRDHRRLYPES